MYIFVLAKNGKPLMPTKRIGHVRNLLEAGKAKIISDAPQYPVIQLLSDAKTYTQPLYGGTHVRGFTKKDDGNPGSFDTAVLDAKGNVIYTDHCVFHEYAGKLGKKYVTCLEVSITDHKKKLLLRPRRIHHRTIPITARYSCNEQEEPIPIAELHHPAYMKRLVCSFDLKSTRAYVAHIHSLQHILPITDWTLDYNPYTFFYLDGTWGDKKEAWNGAVIGYDFENHDLRKYDTPFPLLSALQKGKCAVCHEAPIQEYIYFCACGYDMAVGLCTSCSRKEISPEVKAYGEIDRLRWNRIERNWTIQNKLPWLYKGFYQLFGSEHFQLCTPEEVAEQQIRLGQQANYKGIAVCTAAVRGQTAMPKLDASYFVPERKKWPWW